MRRTLADLIKPAAETAVAPAAGNFMNQANEVIGNLKALFEIAKEYRGMNVQNSQGAGFSSEPKSDLKTSINNILEALIKKGQGDTTIGQIIKEISPATIKQLKELINNVGS